MNAEFLKKEASEFAYRQVADSKQGRVNTRAQAVRTNAALPERSWEVVDTTVYQTQQNVLRLTQDLIDAGLSTETDLMTKHDTWPLVDDRGESNVAMTPEVSSDESALTWADDGVPVPVIYDFFTLGFRESPSEDSGRATEESMDTLGASTTTRRVNELIEYLMLHGWDETIDFDGEGYTLYGLLNHPQTNTASFDEDWTEEKEASDGTVFRDDIRRMRRIIKNDNKFRPGNTGYWLYLGQDLYDTLDDSDPEGQGDQSIRDRMENLSDIDRIAELDFLGPDEALMFRPTEDVIDVGIAAEVQPVMWEDPFRDYWAILGSLYPRVKSTLTDQSGVCHFTV